MTEEILEDFCKILHAIDAIITKDNYKNNMWIRLEFLVDSTNVVSHRFDFEKLYWSNDNSLHINHGIAWNDQYGMHEKFYYTGYNGSLEIESTQYWSQGNPNSVDYEKYKNINKYTTNKY